MLNLAITFFAKKLQRKLIAVITVLIVLVIGALGAYWINSERNKASLTLESRAEMMANLLGQTLSTPMWNIEVDLIQKDIEAVMSDQEVYAIEVYNADGGDPVASAIREGEAVDPIVREANIGHADAQGPAQTIGRVRIIYTRELVNWTTRQNQSLILVVIAALVLILVAGIYFLVGRLVTIPLAEMTGLMEHLAGGDCNITVQTRSRDEVGRMADAFRRMTAYLQRKTTLAEKLAHGDFSEDITPLSNKDMLGSAFAYMIVNLRGLIYQVAQSAEGLNTASAQLASAANQAGRATNQIAGVMGQMATGATQQSQAVVHTTASVDQMALAIDGVARGAQEQATAVGKTATLAAQISQAIGQVSANAQSGARGAVAATQAAQQGAQTVQVAVQGMAMIKEKVGVSTQKVQQMGARSEQIGAIVQTIDDIASQTNLLALNAAIEAARAGEHGKGFAVVADEVRKLAEKSASATKEIAGLIRNIQQTVTEAITAMQDGNLEVETGVARTMQAGESLANILQTVEAVNQQVEAIAASAVSMNTSAVELVNAMESVSAVVEENTAATEEMSANSSLVGQAITNIASISQENSASVEEISASAEEMSAQVQEVSASAQSLLQMADNLRGLVRQFKLPAGEKL